MHKVYLFPILLIVFLISSCTPKESSCTTTTNISGFDAFSSIEDAQACAKESEKPIFIVFDLINSSMRKHQLQLDNVLKEKSISDQFVVTYLFCDDKTKLESSYEAEFPVGRTKTIETVGDKNMMLQIDLFELIAQPYFAIVDHNLNNIKEPHGYFSEEEQLKEYLTLSH